MRYLILSITILFISCPIFAQCNNKVANKIIDYKHNNSISSFIGEEDVDYATDIIPAAELLDEYLHLLKDKKVCILSNQTGMITPKVHLLDTLLSLGVNVTCIMSPEHGFRGNADAGEKVSNSIDVKTGIPIKSLYNGKLGRPSDETINSFDILLFDLQDVGTRFYTYYITMIKMMAVCANFNKEFIVLDRPNPLGFYVDGPILDMKYKSGVGGLPIPIVHGMTLGELANMANQKNWLAFYSKKESTKCNLKIVKCKNYTHKKLYRLPIKPSPNLPDMRSIYLYPSMCYFEATPISLGRGTDKPFQMYGHPNMHGYNYNFTPQSLSGAKNPPQLNKKCFGVDLTKKPTIKEINSNGINLEYIIDAYKNLNIGNDFFTSFFELLVGQSYVREMIIKGKDASYIKAQWEKDIEEFKKIRGEYLLYP